ncbi:MULTISPECIES: hypothetical protein [unclassified Janthinobacterium]|uniref:hypothetical protein n=1 Tax=unclassified Janthinobacterium TaxID=2610881 RepID=UPI00161AA0D0|nr:MULTISPECIES: hypothetical protein [unclassified Janthinobacterium]MBB5607091.1 hypothetical protein [Janthinobacterium sp. S3T4]MBB5612816.1 hypothetical protein [Janthinobacterium sp. S3M3]
MTGVERLRVAPAIDLPDTSTAPPSAPPGLALRKAVNRSLPVTQHAYDVTMRILPSKTLANGWRIHGKTCTANAALPDGRRDAQHRLQPHGAAGQGKRQCRGRVKQAMLRELRARLDTLQAATSGDTSPTAGALQLNRRAFDRTV